MIQQKELNKLRMIVSARDKCAVSVRAWKIALVRDMARPLHLRRWPARRKAFVKWCTGAGGKAAMQCGYERDQIGSIARCFGDHWIVWALISAEHKAKHPEARTW